jgi:hypothetical protein
LFDPAELENSPVDVTTRQMSISLEHVGFNGPPHHQLDDTIWNTLLDQVCDPAVAE